jgi:hypothetical protein
MDAKFLAGGGFKRGEQSRSLVEFPNILDGAGPGRHFVFSM